MALTLLKEQRSIKSNQPASGRFPYRGLRLLLGDRPWAFWLGGFIYLIWAIFGYTVEYVKRFEWRSPFRWSIGGPYLSLYLATVMFYWWPLALIRKPLWSVYAVLYIASTILNVTSHKGPQVEKAG